MATAQTADDIRRRLALVPHPEGGHYRETFRDPASVTPGRAASTAIYFLLEAGEISRWHRIDCAEVWHFYTGAPLELSIAAAADVTPEAHKLGPDLAAGQAPQIVVPPHHWQQARSLGAWTLVGCTVAPGFTFQSFELAPPSFEPGRR
ncbi:MAG: cupin domain-containing protein [Hyphomicrobiaceae bacterium]